MAEGGNVPELGGYDYEFTSKVPEDWECLVCHLTMKDPVQIVGCGHRLCSICMESLLRGPPPTCPADRQPLSRDKIFPDAACHRKILDLTVKCSYSHGCSWTGELRYVENHDSECPFKEVDCTNEGCTENLQRRKLFCHVSFECPWRIIQCRYCQQQIIMNQRQIHFGVCRQFPVQCTNVCGLRNIPREMLAVHVRDECPATEVQCEYKNLGCEGTFPRLNAKSHLETQVEHHLNLALRGLGATQLQVSDLDRLVTDQSQQIEKMMSKDKEQAQKIEKLMSQNTEQAQKIEKLMSQNTEQAQKIVRLVSKDKEQSQQTEIMMCTMKEQSQQMGQLEAKIKEQSKLIERLMSKDQDQSQQIEKLVSKDKAQAKQTEILMCTVKEQSQQMGQLEAEIKEQSKLIKRLMSKDQDQSQQIEKHGKKPNIFFSPFEWRIPFNKKRYNRVSPRDPWKAEVKLSEPFYLLNCGYRYSLKFEVKPAFNFIGYYTNLYIRVIPGESDSLLAWPCKEKIRVTLIDQDPCQEERENISGVIDFAKYNAERPITENAMKYCDIYFRYGTLAKTNLETRSYIKNDAILIIVEDE